MVIIFNTEAKAHELLEEIAVTPAFEGEEPVDLWDWEEDKPLSYLKGQDGRVAVKYPFGPQARVWLATYLEGEANISDELPGDWQYPVEE